MKGDPCNANIKTSAARFMYRGREVGLTSRYMVSPMFRELREPPQRRVRICRPSSKCWAGKVTQCSGQRNAHCRVTVIRDI